MVDVVKMKMVIIIIIISVCLFEKWETTDWERNDGNDIGSYRFLNEQIMSDII